MSARSATRLPKYRHYKPNDLAVVRLDGKDHYLGKYDSEESREKYRRLVAEWFATGHSTQLRSTTASELVGTLTVNDAGTLYSTCLAGHGIAQLFELGTESYLSSKKLVPLFPDWPDERFPLHAYYPTRHHVPAKTRALLNFVAELVQ